MTNRSCEIEVSSDNAALLHMIRNGSGTAWRTRHISVKALWMHQISRRRIKFTYQPTAEMAADSLTKGLGSQHPTTDQRRPLSRRRVCPGLAQSGSTRCHSVSALFECRHNFRNVLHVQMSLRTACILHASNYLSNPQHDVLSESTPNHCTLHDSNYLFEFSARQS